MTVSEAFFRYQGQDGAALAGFRWLSAAKPRALLQLAHGAGEHAGRYRDRLAPIVEAGFIVYAADHRGHGLTSGIGELGNFGPGGAAACVLDMAELSKIARAEHPGLPLILMGHSMGSLFAQAYVLEHGALIDGLVLSGTIGSGPMMEGPPNSAFPNPRTEYDWLSRDEREVDRYIADPFCGIRFNEASQASLAVLARPLRSQTPSPPLPPGFPVYIFVGDRDPINNRLAALRPLVEAYQAAGLAVTLRVHPEGRHEMLNEVNRDEVVDDLKNWLVGLPEPGRSR